MLRFLERGLVFSTLDRTQRMFKALGFLWAFLEFLVSQNREKETDVFYFPTRVPGRHAALKGRHRWSISERSSPAGSYIHIQ